MANTYTQIYLQFVFATLGRNTIIAEKNREEIEKYITGIIHNKGQKLLAVYANPDHIHIFISYKDLRISIPELIKVIKTESTRFINSHNYCVGKFQWQEGYGAFSYAKSQKEAVVAYILNQKKHHEKKSFREEYKDFLLKFEIEYEDKYLFDFYDK